MRCTDEVSTALPNLSAVALAELAERSAILGQAGVAQARPNRAKIGTCRPGSATHPAQTGPPMTGDAGRGARSAAWGTVAVVSGGGVGVMGASAAAPMRICAGGLALVAAAGLYLCFATVLGWFPFRRRSPHRELTPEEVWENGRPAELPPAAAPSVEQNGERRWFAELRLSLRFGRRSG